MGDSDGAGGLRLVLGEGMAELVSRRVIQYATGEVRHFSTAQQYMASEIASAINADVERYTLTATEAREVLRFLVAQLEEKS